MNNIYDLIKTGEGYTIEFKERFSSSISKEICAFANASGEIIKESTQKSTQKTTQKTAQKILELLKQNPNLTQKESHELVSSKWSEKWSERWSELSKREIEILILRLINPNITRLRLSSSVGINSSAIQKQIDKLKQKGLIKRIGADRGGHWEVLE